MIVQLTTDATDGKSLTKMLYDHYCRLAILSIPAIVDSACKSHFQSIILTYHWTNNLILQIFSKFNKFLFVYILKFLIFIFCIPNFEFSFACMPNLSVIAWYYPKFSRKYRNLIEKKGGFNDIYKNIKNFYNNLIKIAVVGNVIKHQMNFHLVE